MKKLIVVAMIAVFGIMVSGVDYAEAKRFGMGSSFGKKRMSQPKSNSFSQQKAAPQKQTAAGNQRGSARTGMMGMIGGLALGGLLGAMFFGGAFEGIKLFDILLIGGGIFLIMYFLRRRSPQQHAYAGQETNYHNEPSVNTFPGSADAVQEEFDFDDQNREPVGSAVRPEVDASHFLPAAKEIYMRMQKAWDSGDIEDIRRFCTPEIADRIAQDMSPNSENHTEVATLHAEIADSWVESDMEWVAVNYSAMLREQAKDHTGATVEDQTAEVNEVWIFQHTPNSDDPTWYLAGIQQAH